MNFADTPRVVALRERLHAFMDTVVYPNERTYAEQHASAENHWASPPVMEEMKAQARADPPLHACHRSGGAIT